MRIYVGFINACSKDLINSDNDKEKNGNLLVAEDPLDKNVLREVWKQQQSDGEKLMIFKEKNLIFVF